MKVCFATADSFNRVWQERLTKTHSPDTLVVGFNGFGLISYKKELLGETEYFSDVARLSKALSSVVICGADTDTYGVFRHSAVVADNGKILGVSDMTHVIDQSEFSPGANLTVYNTKKGKIGVIVCEDLFFPQVVKTLALCDADLIVCLLKRVENYIPQTLIRANAFTYGVPIALCAKNYACVADTCGQIAFQSSQDISITHIKTQKKYRLIKWRARGYFS